MLNILSNTNSILNQIIYEMRNINIQNDRPRFRRNLERVGIIAAYEISKKLSYTPEDVQTLLGNLVIETPDDELVLIAILRAGLPLQNGLLEIFNYAETGFISAYRKVNKSGGFDIKMDYITCPSLEGKVVVFSDPMLATGSSLISSMEMIANYGTPKEIHLVSVIASEYAVEQVRRLYPAIQIWVGAVDEELTAKSYIVPGLGDAGDLAFGEKLQG